MCKMSGVLYLFGILIKNIELNDIAASTKTKREISFNIRFSDFINVDIVLEDLLTDDEQGKEMETVENIEINTGKTYLFSSSCKDLLAEMRKSPLEISLSLMRKKEGVIFHM